MASNEVSLEKSAILMLALGEEEASEVFKYLGPKEVQKIGMMMAKVKNVPMETVDEITAEFLEKTGTHSTLGLDSDNYIRSVLTKALGTDKAGFLLDRILTGGDTSGIESLKWMDAGTVSELIKNEHPQIIATILVHLERDHAAGILNKFADRLRTDVILRIATLDGIQPNALKELNEVLAKTLSGENKVKKSILGGTKAAAEILNFVGGATEQMVISTIKEYDPDLSQKIQDEMFVFDNLIDIDDRGIQTIMRDLQSDQLVLALKGASDDLKAKIFKNMSSRAAESLKEDLESKGPVRLSEVEAAQKEILKTVRTLADQGQIQLGGGGDDAFV